MIREKGYFARMRHVSQGSERISSFSEYKRRTGRWWSSKISVGGVGRGVGIEGGMRGGTAFEVSMRLSIFYILLLLPEKKIIRSNKRRNKVLLVFCEAVFWGGLSIAPAKTQAASDTLRRRTGCRQGDKRSSGSTVILSISIRKRKGNKGLAKKKQTNNKGGLKAVCKHTRRRQTTSGVFVQERERALTCRTR